MSPVYPHDSTSPLPRVSIVIVTYDAVEMLKKCLPSVMDSNYPNLEVILADNASTDGSAEWVAGAFPRVRIVRHPENWEYCRGNNVAARTATGKYLVLLNNDVEVTPDWLNPLVQRLERDPSVAVVQPKLLQYSDRTRFEYAGGAGGHLDRYGFPFTRGRIFFEMEEDRGQYDSDHELFWASGAAFIIRKSLFDALGGLDERLRMHMEEIDLCWRLKLGGYRIVAEPQSRVFHIGGASLPSYNPLKTYLNYRNSLLILFKNLPPKEFRRIFPFRFLLDMIAAIRALLRLKGGECFAIVRAYGSAHVMKKTFAEERRNAGSGVRGVLPDYRGSIVIDYFVRGKKRFSDLDPGQFSD